MIFSLVYFICATGALEIAAYVSHETSYQVGFNMLASVRTHGLQHDPARQAFNRFFDSNDSDVVFRGTNPDTVLSKRAEIKDLQQAFELIYRAAKQGFVKDAFAFLLRLKKIPHFLGFPDFPDEADWNSFKGHLQQTDYKKACALIADRACIVDQKKRQELLSFFCAHYHVKNGVQPVLVDQLDAERAVLSRQVKKHIEDQLWHQRMASTYTLHQIGIPVLVGMSACLWGVLAFIYFDDAAKKLGFSITAAVTTFLGVLINYWTNSNKYLLEQYIKWESLLQESNLQRTADLISSFFTVLGYKQEADETFIGQRAVTMAIQDQYGTLLRIRQALPAGIPGYRETEQFVSLEKLVMRYPRQS